MPMSLLRSVRAALWPRGRFAKAERVDAGHYRSGHAARAPAYVARSLESVREKHAVLLDRIPCVPHVQSARLLLQLCAKPRCNYLLRVLPPGDTGGFAEAHDRAVARCLDRRAQLPLRFGGLGLPSAAASRVAAHWASWADSMLVICARHPRILARLLPGLADPHGALGPPCTRAAAHAEATLRCRLHGSTVGSPG